MFKSHHVDYSGDSNFRQLLDPREGELIGPRDSAENLSLSAARSSGLRFLVGSLLCFSVHHTEFIAAQTISLVSCIAG